jgi:hypothetical protein
MSKRVKLQYPEKQYIHKQDQPCPEAAQFTNGVDVVVIACEKTLGHKKECSADVFSPHGVKIKVTWRPKKNG